MKSLRMLVISMILIFPLALFASEEENVVEIKIPFQIQTKKQVAFDRIVPIELSKIFRPYGRLPGIKSTNETEKWIKPGLTRRVEFEDGDTAIETLDQVNPSHDFSYHIESFTSPLRFLANRIEGEWIFTDVETGSTAVQWTYRVHLKNAFARGIFTLFVKKDLEGMLKQATEIIIQDLEG